MIGSLFVGLGVGSPHDTQNGGPGSDLLLTILKLKLNNLVVNNDLALL